ncbi:GntR family transcriptional regulator [Microbacterium testaceum]|uniref:GntR family transcriptional regulator n=1 Tax=Microbacterium testaceum TaxID=2033 RepID=UPI002AC3C750|nr:GntR family transcriptional regulator [Microbacterium testaceum]MDZ5144787.1 GntR family transcriptional regulator [Microbacterium testaceum]
MAHTIERVSPVPYYEQLYEILREQISQGEIAEEERLPSELELCREFGLSRATVRQTLTKLENDGYAHRIPRRGVFASVPGQTAGWTVQEGFLESQLRHGRTGITTTVVQTGYVTPEAHVADALRVGPDTEVFALERVRSLDGRRAMYSTNWFPREVARTIASESGVLDGSASLNGHLRSAGFISSGAQRVIHALAAPDAVAAHLDVEPGHPVLRVRSSSWAADGTRFDYYETWVLTDVIPLEVSVSAS